jgi:hypothetical protein
MTNSMDLKSLENFAFSEIDVDKIYKKTHSSDIYSNSSLKSKYRSTEEDDSKSKESFINKIIDDALVDDIFESGMEELYLTYENERKIATDEKNARSHYGLEDGNDHLFETMNNIKEVIDKIENGDHAGAKVKEKDHIKEKIREQLSMFVGNIDNNINLVKDDLSGLVLGKDALFRKMSNNKHNKSFIDGMRVKNIEGLDKTLENFSKEVLLIELNPEHVIPITVGSQHIAYYVFEADAYMGPSGSNIRKNTSFAQIIASTGLGNDTGVINASNGVSIMPNDPSLSSVFNPANFSNINMPLQGSAMLDNNRRTEIMKQIVFKTLAQRLEDPSLIDNKAFQDAIMNLIREGYIIQRRVQFTYVPGANMVYFAHDLDDKGLPHSILDGTLLQIYMYLAGIVSATMDIVKSSSDKEKFEVNMGISNQIGLTMLEIQRNLATRNIHVRSFFDNIASVLRNTATYLRVTIPVVDGEKLYDVSPVDQPTTNPIDTEFINQRLASILSAMPVPPSIQNMISDVEFSRGIINQNIEYRNSILEKQSPTMDSLTKLYKILVMYSELAMPTKIDLKDDSNQSDTDPNKVKIKKINLQRIKVDLAPPQYLNMMNINEIFTNVEPVIEQYIKYYFGEDGIDDPMSKMQIKRAKTKLLELFAPGVDVSTMWEILNKIENTPTEGVAQTLKKKKIAGMLNDEDSSGGY